MLEKQHDTGGALVEYRSSQEIMAKLPSDVRENIGSERDEAYLHDAVGALLKERGALADALSELRAEPAARELIAGKDPEDIGAQQGLSDTHDKVGILKDLGDLAGALRQFEARLTLEQLFAEKKPTDTGLQKTLQAGCPRRRHRMDQGDATDALKDFEESKGS